MKRFILSIFSCIVCGIALWAVPANPRPMPVVQPNGDTLIVRMQGDERFHFRVTEDGYLIAQNAKGYYCYAKWSEPADGGRKQAVPTRKKARNEADRSKCQKRWLVRHNIPKKEF